MLVTTTQLKEIGETVEENDHMCRHGVCCYVTGRRCARGVNQQPHVSKGASPAHSPEVGQGDNPSNNAATEFTTRQEPTSFHVLDSLMQYDLNYVRRR